MSITKRILSVAVCAVLLFAGGIIGAEASTDCAGAGNGVNAKVENLETLGEVIDSLSSRQKTEKARAVVRDGDEETAKYTSGTVIEIAKAYSTMDMTESSSGSSYSSSSSSSRMDFSRTLTGYYGENASFYEADAQIASSSSTYSSGSTSITKSTLDMKVRIYVAEDCVMFYLSRLNYHYYEVYTNNGKPEDNYTHTEMDTAQGKAYGVMKEYCNRWIDCTETPGVAEAFLKMDSNNLKSLLAFSDLIEEEMNSEESNFKESGNVFTLKRNAFLKFFGLSASKDDADNDGDCEIDLSTRTEPKISYWLTLNSEDSYSGDSYGGYKYSYSYKSNGDADVVMKFKNINNTVVNKPSGKVVSIAEINDRTKELGDD